MTEIKEEDFTAIKLPATAISSDYVVKMSDVTGGVAKNTIYQKEILAFSHIAEEGYTPDKNLLTTVVPKYYDNIQPGDLVNVYAVSYTHLIQVRQFSISKWDRFRMRK